MESEGIWGKYSLCGLAGEVNTAMPAWVLGKAESALNERGQAVKNSNILLLGIAYKEDVSDTRIAGTKDFGHAESKRS